MFSDRIADIAFDRDYAHFGDYSIEGATYRDGGGGGPTRNVALHLVYSTAGAGTQLREMIAWYGDGGEYSLGEGKEMGMRHHLELMTVAQ